LRKRVADIRFRLELLRTVELKIYLGAGIPSATRTREGCLMTGGNLSNRINNLTSVFRGANAKLLPTIWNENNEPSKPV
jgi:hypothetical protein